MSTDTIKLRYLKGVGENLEQKLHRIGLFTINDLIENIPRSFDDYSRVMQISRVKPGKVTIEATIHNVSSRYSRNGLSVVEAVARDGSGQIQLTWFNQPYIAKSIKNDTSYFISGEFAKNYRYFCITNPKIELVSAFPKHTARLVPTYRLTKGLSAHQMRKLIAEALQNSTIDESLPQSIIDDYELMDRKTALQNIHFPQDMHLFTKAKARLAFEELFIIMLASELNRRDFALQNSYIHTLKSKQIKRFTDSLPFTLTDDQRLAAWKMLNMMQEDKPMNSLLQGDVGSGKTVVALLLCINAIENGAQVAFMAPTELLAAQHYATIQKLLPSQYKDKTVLLSGSMTKKSKNTVYEKIQSGEASLIVGTHALIQSKLMYNNLQFVVVDEQHRFGVSQRKALQNKADKMPHVLHMSATPIPRSIALTLYGELDVVTINRKPNERKFVSTKIISSDHREKFYKSVVKETIDKKEQVFIVAPRIEEDDSENTTLSVEKVSRDIAKWLPDAKLKTIHGKLPQEHKDAIMQDVSSGFVDVLVSTTVIEVGIDVPNATLMVIEDADSFGLAQLHQLRGRVGRGEKEGTCVLISSKNETSQRLRVMETESSGFVLAEYDLELRGPGAIYGSMQHGALDLRIASISDTELIESARNAAKAFIASDEKLVKYSKINNRVSNIRAITNLN